VRVAPARGARARDVVATEQHLTPRPPPCLASSAAAVDPFDFFAGPDAEDVSATQLFALPARASRPLRGSACQC
jgi:hypothetical protein